MLLSTVGAGFARPNAYTNAPFGVLSGGQTPPLRWMHLKRERKMNSIATHRRGRLNLPDNIPMVYLWMHYSQGRDRWFGRIQSAPTVEVYLKQLIQKRSVMN
jgi:hypothetical protein